MWNACRKYFTKAFLRPLTEAGVIVRHAVSHIPLGHVFVA